MKLEHQKAKLLNSYQFKGQLFLVPKTVQYDYFVISEPCFICLAQLFKNKAISSFFSCDQNTLCEMLTISTAAHHVMQQTGQDMTLWWTLTQARHGVKSTLTK